MYVDAQACTMYEDNSKYHNYFARGRGSLIEVGLSDGNEVGVTGSLDGDERWLPS